MKRITFLSVMVLLAASICAANFLKNETTQMYDYTGPALDKYSVDFSKWAADSLVDEAVGTDYTSGAPTMKFEERGGMGFQKIVIYKNRWMATGITTNAAFHNGKDNASLSKKTDAATFFLPKIKSGIKTLTLSATYGDKMLEVLSYDSLKQQWDSIGLLKVGKTYADYSITINDENVKTLAFRTLKGNGGAYLSITHINVIPMAKDTTPEPIALYKKTASGTYEYQGEPVHKIDVDFSKWSTTDLPSKLSDTMSLTEVDSLGFVKWKIASRPVGEKGTINALFNNDNSDFSDGPKNNATSNKPRIYLPTTVRGVKTLSAFGGTSKSAVPLYVYYKDDNNTSWTRFQIKSVDAPLNFPAGCGEASLEMNSTGKTTIYIECGVTSWPAIATLNVVLEDENPTNFVQTKMANKVNKVVENGRLYIVRDGIKYNALGQQL